jgi:predicted small lipoprotein YifL
MRQATCYYVSGKKAKERDFCMKGKKWIALFLAVMMLLTMAACGETTVEAYDTGEKTAEETTTTTTALDFDKAYATHDPEEVVFYVDDDPVTWQELFYEIAYYTNYLSYYEGTTITDMNGVCSLFTDADGNYYTYGAVVLQNAVTMLEQYHIVYKHLTDMGVVLGKEALDQVELVRQNAIDQNFDGDEQAFLEYLDNLYCTEELWNWFNQVDALYAYDGFEAIYGAMGADLGDDEVMAYAAGDPDGNWTEYGQLKQIYLYTEDEQEEEADTEEDAQASEETASQATDEATTADTILTALDNGEDFDALYAQYNENEALDNYPDGWCVYEGDTDDAIYQAALAMADGEYTAVSIDGADVIVQKVPVDPDGVVYYDTTTDTAYTLRYYAAWQNYSELINGEDGWIATAQADWAEGFENFSLEDIFA